MVLSFRLVTVLVFEVRLIPPAPSQRTLSGFRGPL